MNTTVEKRRNALINMAFIVVVLGLIYVFLKYCFAIAAPFLLSFFFAVLLQRPLRWLDKKTKHKCHGLWSVILVLAVIAIILIPIGLILAALFREIGSFVNYLSDQLSDLPTFLVTLEKELLSFLKFLPGGLYTTVSDKITVFFGGLINDFDLSTIGIDTKSITNGITTSINGVYNVAKNVPSVLIGLVIGIIAWIFFTKDYRYIVNFIKLQLPDGKKNLLVEIKQVFSKTILKMVRAYLIIMFITFCELFLGMSIMNLAGIMNNSYIFIMAICVAIFDILPVAGSGGILIPWSIINLIIGNYSLAIGILIMYAIITVVRQYIEPKIVGSSLGVHPLITLAGLYFGLKLFGFMGMFIVPISVMTIKAFNDTGRIHLYKIPDRN